VQSALSRPNGCTIIEYVFESVGVGAADAVACADLLAASITEERLVVARKLATVARWADLHHPDRELASLESLPAGERARRRCRVPIGAEGTPMVSTFAVAELACLLQTTTHAAEALLRDVLELRHRLPQTWDAVLTGRVDAWKARQVARVTRPLSFDRARLVDGLVIEALLGLPWGRALAVVEGKVIAVDPEGHDARRRDEEAKHFVSTRRRSNAYGVRTMIARGAAGDIARLEAMIAHLADLMARNGDADPSDTRRAKALALLANPALACVHLAHAHDTGTDGADETAATPDAQPDAPTLFGEAVTDLAPASPSAVELAVAFGRILKQLGGTALDRLRPRSVLYLHLSADAVQGPEGTGVVRVDDPIAGGPIGISQLRAWLANDRITVKPVVDPTDTEPVDGYEIPLQHREAMHLLAPYEVWPYGTTATRWADIDHTVPYVPPDDGGPPGQTALGNLGPLGRRHHLAKTFDGFTVHQPVRGLYLWRTPTGHWFRVDHRGTARLGKERPPTLELADRHESVAMTVVERRLRDGLLLHLAA
jgi:hypothetical protein